jgi:hypothetical protein
MSPQDKSVSIILCTDPRIRISLKMSRIRNTAFKTIKCNLNINSIIRTVGPSRRPYGSYQVLTARSQLYSIPAQYDTLKIYRFFREKSYIYIDKDWQCNIYLMIQSRIRNKLLTIMLLSKINTQPPNQICTNAITQRRGQVLAGPFSDVTSAEFNSETISSLFSYFISAALLS